MSRFVVRPPDYRQKRSIILCLLLILATLAFYNPIIHNGFTNFDDNQYITENAHLRSGLTWSTFKWALTSFDAANWHPLTWLSHALDYQLFKLNPLGPHYVNVLLHSANAVLLFLLLQAATEATWPSIFVAALFALHPINVESVAWAAERKNVLSMFFFLLIMHAYSSYARRPNVRRLALVIILFALGLMAKPEIITLPFVLLLWDYWPLRRMVGRAPDSQASAEIQPRSLSWLVFEKVPLFVLSAASAVVTVIAQRSGHTLRAAPFHVRLANALVAYVRYLGKAFWPSRLAVMYPHFGRLLTTWQIVGSAALLVLLTGFVFYWRERHYLAMGWFWFLGTLVPVIGLVQVGVQSMADRYAYLSFIGLFICVTWTVSDLAEQRKVTPAWLVAPSLAVLAMLGILTFRQVGYWSDSETLWKHTLAVTDHNYVAHDALARALAGQGRVDDAIPQFKAAEALHAYSSSDMVWVAQYELAQNHVHDAIEELEHAVNAAEDANSRAEALSSLGSAYMQAHDFASTRVCFVAALQQNPNDAVALVGTGLLAEHDGNNALAVTQISRATQLAPTDVGYLLLAQALRRSGRVAEASDAEAQAARLSRDIVFARRSASKILEMSWISQ
jgi:protein O-mannosyl-transferase